MTWLLDTLVWTGALIALVLCVRRPISRQFGARTAYALWALPLVRLALPPIVLPAWMAPVSTPIAVADLPVPATAVVANGTVAAAMPAPSFDWLAAVLAVWLAGATVYFVVRLAAYGQLRRDLLEGARPVGEVGRIRLVETPATPSPLAFGVIDKVIALPPGFMSTLDRMARDLALAHELAHHRSNDLAVNFAALPLFALHWFNPLSWLGWRAMRRDQEAACDARVVEHRDRAERAIYASVIATAAATPAKRLNMTLAAPMACPVLGDKSIIARLRNLTMTDHTTRRRRAGLLLIGAAALALPLTASVSYAQEEIAPPPPPPTPPPALGAPLAPVTPAPPVAPTAPAAPSALEPRVTFSEVPSSDGKVRKIVVVRPGSAGHRPLALRDGARVERRIVMRGKDGKVIDPDSPEFAARMEQLDRELEGLDERIERSIVIDERKIERSAERAAAAGVTAQHLALRAPTVVENCDGDGDVSDVRAKGGKRIVRICQVRIEKRALGGLKAAREAIARNSKLSGETRAEVLADLDEEIARLEAGN